jgi:hypothetical protein
VTAGVDDPGAGQQQPDGPYVKEIIGHFVDEEGLRRLALNARLV